MTDPYVEDEINLRDYWRVLVRRRFCVLGITFTVAVVVAVFTLLQPNIYQSKATLMPLGKATGGLSGMLGELEGLLPIASLNQESPAERILAILNSRTLAEDVIQRLDLLPRLFEKDWDFKKQQWITNEPPTIQDAVKKFQREVVSITSDKKTGVIAIVAEHTDPELAAAIGNQSIDALQRLLDDNAFSLAKKNRLFIEGRLQETRKSLQVAEETLRSFEQKHGIVSLDAQTAASVFSLNQAPEVKLQYARLRREALLQNKLFTMLVQRLEQAKIEEARDETAFQVLDEAIPAEKKSGPKRALSIILAMVVGSFLGIFVAFFREYAESTIQTREQIERQVGLQVLATVPLPVRGRRRKRQPSEPIKVESFRHQPAGSPMDEAYRYLHTRLRSRDCAHDLNAVLLTSPGPNDATPSILVNLAMISAMLGEKTLLVDGYVRHPILHQLLQGSSTPGLADILLDETAEWCKCVQSTSVHNLHFLPAGNVRPTTFAALESPAFEVLLAHVKKTYGLILFGAPPVVDNTDAAVLSSKVDATCLVLTRGVSNFDAVVDARTALEDVQAKVIGAIFLDHSRSSSK